MNTDQRIKNIIDEFTELSSWEEKYKLLIKHGKQLQTLPDEHKIQTNIVKGCQSQVWLHAELKENKIYFYGDSDASIVKGIVGLLLSVYNELSPDEVLDLDLGFIDLIGLNQHLSMSRANGLASMIKQIKLYALAFQTKIKMGLA